MAWWSSGRTRTPTKSSRLFFSPLDHPQVPLVDVCKHQLIAMASMKIIRAVALFGGLFTAVASSSTEYGPLFAEYVRVTQHKEESGKHQLLMTASMKVIRVMAPSGGPTTAWVAAGLEDEASSVQPASCKRRSRLRGGHV